jgi:arylformamidase
VNSPTQLQLRDLSHPLRLGTQGFPGCAQVIGWRMRGIEWSNYNMLHVSSDLHTGTHVDAMLHCMPDGIDAAALPLANCVGPAVVIDLRAKGIKGAVFTPDDFFPFETEIRKYHKVLATTGWAKKWETADYYSDFPGFTRECAEYLVKDLGIHLIGVEQPSVHPIDHLEVHRRFFQGNVIIVEGLADLESIPCPLVDFFAAPLRFEGADGSLVRAFCRF